MVSESGINAQTDGRSRVCTVCGCINPVHFSFCLTCEASLPSLRNSYITQSLLSGQQKQQTPPQWTPTTLSALHETGHTTYVSAPSTKTLSLPKPQNAFENWAALQPPAIPYTPADAPWRLNRADPLSNEVCNMAPPYIQKANSGTQTVGIYFPSSTAVRHMIKNTSNGSLNHASPDDNKRPILATAISPGQGYVSYLAGSVISLDHCHHIRATQGIMFYTLPQASNNRYTPASLSRPPKSGFLGSMQN
ncbi:unnamed protein product [Protopolystoma xenopodis]|uniref:Uncharacterized protein n=1 Tax=Protopolystoma xenopodis TaxID=117903 RepID=A0A3S5ABS0_9PLAT|nr:unnamed protein product [Protopolystoma xenopodis]